MKIEAACKNENEARAVITVWLYDNEDNFSAGEKLAEKNLNEMIKKLLSQNSELTKYGKINIVYTAIHNKFQQVVLVGAGVRTELTADRARVLAATMLSTVELSNKLVECRPGLSENQLKLFLQAIVEGFILGSYRFEHYKTEKKTTIKPEEILIRLKDPYLAETAARDVADYIAIAQAVCTARDLVNYPANYLTPAVMAEYAIDLANKSGLEINVLDEFEIEKLKMGVLLAVAKGSSARPKLILLKYIGNPDSNELVAFVGKGVTFDSGGISIKPAENMAAMKDDMAGGAAVLGAMQAIGKIRPKVNILGVIPCVENMPSGHALKPGDIVTAMAGKTIEIITTDAEGRLLLADAVTYARRLGATKIVDIATLTGACVIALGTNVSGVITNNAAWCKTVLQAAAAADEKMWQLPAFVEYSEQIKSSIADLKNSGGKPGGTITAGLFIGEFAQETPWVHIDIAGTAKCETNCGYNLKGGTGVGVRTLVQLARTL